MTLLDALADGTETPICSRAGCRELALWRIEWRNPRIHAADRRKTWLACADHIDYLREFLAAREFPLQVLPLQDAPDAHGSHDTEAPVSTD